MLHCASLNVCPCARNLEAKLLEAKLLCHVVCAFKLLTDTAKRSPSPDDVQSTLPAAACGASFPHPPQQCASFWRPASKQPAPQREGGREPVSSPHACPALNPGARSADLAAERGAPLSAPWGAQLRNDDERHGDTLLHFDLKSAPQFMAPQGQNALMADNMLYLYSSWM